ncbi:hypothetical protein P4V86_11255 [Brevibacillus laterosporus]|uniref:hypothetical protein n=1 Tax=Brevibacillus laterosporus TaxID=1465 RepID=UPI00037D6D82|nr:hypothetical protein [Brevibacillus laterosporus]ATO48025.1 hypothetical protein BrL25_02195 [Brevibacillus laterosporus DSM 25]MBG9801687.1 hypothetical protein [Brevibacillus laterosporus]MCG7316607.1 hypothetical protein [Brevibacillus laterosporus]MED2003927.1 hypothetical protein [Brevibacillus laterosporus]MED4762409.1 hypothetical protein [Brevibacillus laterosporus]
MEQEKSYRCPKLIHLPLSSGVSMTYIDLLDNHAPYNLNRYSNSGHPLFDTSHREWKVNNNLIFLKFTIYVF